MTGVPTAVRLPHRGGVRTARGRMASVRRAGRSGRSPGSPGSIGSRANRRQGTRTGSMTTEPQRPTALAALLLTGGSSRRMGQPKAAIVVDGTSLADRTAALLALVSDPVIEVGPGYTNLVRVQESPAGGGPLAAVAAGWATVARSRESALVVAT